MYVIYKKTITEVMKSICQKLVPNHASPVDRAVKNCSTSFGTPLEDLFAIGAHQHRTCVATRQHKMGCGWVSSKFYLYCFVVVSWFGNLTNCGYVHPGHAVLKPSIFSASSHMPDTSRRVQILQSISKQYVLSSPHVPTWHVAPICSKAA